jgi:hypothetical protein
MIRQHPRLLVARTVPTECLEGWELPSAGFALKLPVGERWLYLLWWMFQNLEAVTTAVADAATAMVVIVAVNNGAYIVAVVPILWDRHESMRKVNVDLYFFAAESDSLHPSTKVCVEDEKCYLEKVCL